ncbi:MAG: hypothetical protein R3B93_01530 [Bacteroidia bacterium]
MSNSSVQTQAVYRFHKGKRCEIKQVFSASVGRNASEPSKASLHESSVESLSGDAESCHVKGEKKQAIALYG